MVQTELREGKDEVEGERGVFFDYEEAAQGYTTTQDP